jgi:hypothetical protein
VACDHRLTSKARTALAQSSAESTHPHRHSPACRRVHQLAAVDSVDGGKTSVLHSPRAMHVPKLRLDLRLSIAFSVINPRQRSSERAANPQHSTDPGNSYDACVHPHTLVHPDAPMLTTGSTRYRISTNARFAFGASSKFLIPLDNDPFADDNVQCREREHDRTGETAQFTNRLATRDRNP